MDDANGEQETESQDDGEGGIDDELAQLEALQAEQTTPRKRKAENQQAHSTEYGIDKDTTASYEDHLWVADHAWQYRVWRARAFSSLQ